MPLRHITLPKLHPLNRLLSFPPYSELRLPTRTQARSLPSPISLVRRVCLLYIFCVCAELRAACTPSLIAEYLFRTPPPLHSSLFTRVSPLSLTHTHTHGRRTHRGRFLQAAEKLSHKPPHSLAAAHALTFSPSSPRLPLFPPSSPCAFQSAPRLIHDFVVVVVPGPLSSPGTPLARAPSSIILYIYMYVCVRVCVCLALWLLLRVSRPLRLSTSACLMVLFSFGLIQHCGMSPPLLPLCLPFLPSLLPAARRKGAHGACECSFFLRACVSV